jgi:hypothetical protein
MCHAFSSLLIGMNLGSTKNVMIAGPLIVFIAETIFVLSHEPLKDEVTVLSAPVAQFEPFRRASSGAQSPAQRSPIIQTLHDQSQITFF